MAVDRWSPELLDSMRTIEDPLADDLVRGVLDSGGVPALMELNRFLQHWDAPIDDTVPPGIRAFLEQPVSYPDWCDHQQLVAGQKLFQDTVVSTLLVLFARSLSQYFANADSDQVFVRADVFAPSMVKRLLLEVAQLLIDVMRPGGLDVEPEKSIGVIAMQKLRLHHSVVRLQVLPDPRLQSPNGPQLPPWQSAWGGVLNQEDLAGAIVAFQIWTTEGLAKLDIELTPEQQETSLVTWKVIGFLLGMDERLQPVDVDDARALLEAVGRRQFRASPGGTQLANQLLGIFQGFFPKFLKSLPIYLMRYLMDKKYVDMLEIPQPAGPWRLILWLMSIVIGDLGLGKRLANDAGQRLQEWMATAEGRHGNRGEFRTMPASSSD